MTTDNLNPENLSIMEIMENIKRLSDDILRPFPTNPKTHEDLGEKP